MNRRRWIRGAAAVVVVLVVARFGALLFLRDTPPTAGAWVNTAPYAAAAPGAVGLVLHQDGRVVVTGVPASGAWGPPPGTTSGSAGTASKS